MSVTRVVATRHLRLIPIAWVIYGGEVRKQFVGFTCDHARHRANMWLAFNEWDWDE